MKYTLPQLPYSYGALEPFIDSRTMEIHHTKHHQTYVDKLNVVLEKHPSIADTPVDHLLAGLDALKISDKDKAAIRNHGGGHLNHSQFWMIMGPSKQIDERLAADLTRLYGSLETFKKEFTELATTLFGSGWVWLSRDRHGDLTLQQFPNQDSPHLKGWTPVIGLDVWEHAYYLKYQNRRAEYIKAWWNTLTLLP